MTCDPGVDDVPFTIDTDDTSLGSTEGCDCAHLVTGSNFEPDWYPTDRTNATCLKVYSGV